MKHGIVWPGAPPVKAPGLLFFRDFLEGHLIRQRLTAVPVLHRNSRRKPPNSFGWRNAANLSLPIYWVVPDERRVSFHPPVLRYFHEHEILHHQSSDHHRRSRPPSAAEELQLRLQPSERRHGWWMGSCSDTWSAPFLQGLGVAFRVQLPPEGAQTQTRALIQFRGEATF